MAGPSSAITIGLLAGFVLGVWPVSAQLTKDELRCEITTDKTLSKVTAAKTKCLMKCEQRARKGEVPFAQCEPPYASDTLACIADVVKGAQSKAIQAIAKGCAKDCPECYGDCSLAGAPAARVAYAAGEVDMFVPLIGCEDTTDKLKGKCIDVVARTLAKFTGARDKCHQKCALAVFKGFTTPLTCQPPASHPDTQACLAQAEGKAAAAIDKACVTPPAMAPACYDGTPPNTGAGWVALAKMSIDGDHADIFCGSPGAAFLD